MIAPYGSRQRYENTLHLSLASVWGTANQDATRQDCNCGSSSSPRFASRSNNFDQAFLQPSRCFADERQFTQALDVAEGRIAEESLVFPTEMRGVVIANLKACLRRVQALGQHQPAGLL
jgi:hypothetical protein